MDPSVMKKLLEEDEDENMHSGADVEAFTAALNRDIGGEMSIPQTSNAESGSSLVGQQNSSHMFQQWKFYGQHNTSQHNQTISPDLVEVETLQQKMQPSCEMEMREQVSDIGNLRHQFDANKEFNHLKLESNGSHDQHGQPEEEAISFQPSQPTGLTNTQLESMKFENADYDCLHQQPENVSTVFSHTAGAQNSSENHVLQGQNNKHNSESDFHSSKSQGMSGQQSTTQEQPSSQLNRGMQVPFAALLPVILHHLNAEQAMQLDTLYTSLRKNEIGKEEFTRRMKNMVGDQLIRLAVMNIRARLQSGASHFPLPSQALARQQHLQMSSGCTQLLKDPHSFSENDQNGRKPPSDPFETPYPIVQAPNDLGFCTNAESSAKELMKMEQQSDLLGRQMPSVTMKSVNNQETYHTSIPIQGLSRHQQQHLHMPQSSCPLYESGSLNYNPNFSTNTIASTTPKIQPHDSHTRLQSGSKTQLNTSTSQQKSVTRQQPNAQPVLHEHNISAGLKDELVDKSSSSASLLTSSSMLQAELNILAVSTFPSTGINTKGTPIKPSIGQKKPLEATTFSPPQPSKKQKMSVAISDQSIDQLNDVTAVSGVNLREEEEQLFPGPKEECGVSEATRRVVLEEEKLLLQRIPLQKKLAKIVAKCGVTSISSDVERCLSLCVEERLRGLITSLIKSSKQRADVEKARHHVLITSDVREQIFQMNQKVMEEWERTRATSDKIQNDKIQKQNEADGDTVIEGDKQKVLAKSVKPVKEDDDKMRAAAANVAARAAVGGDDMLSKWQLMAEQARQKRESANSGLVSHPGRSHMLKPLGLGRTTSDYHDPGHASAISGSQHVSQDLTGSDAGAVSTISMKDVIAVLEREPQTVKSTLIYRLYNKIHGSDPAAG